MVNYRHRKQPKDWVPVSTYAIKNRLKTSSIMADSIKSYIERAENAVSISHYPNFEIVKFSIEFDR